MRIDATQFLIADTVEQTDPRPWVSGLLSQMPKDSMTRITFANKVNPNAIQPFFSLVNDIISRVSDENRLVWHHFVNNTRLPKAQSNPPELKPENYELILKELLRHIEREFTRACIARGIEQCLTQKLLHHVLLQLTSTPSLSDPEESV